MAKRLPKGPLSRRERDRVRGQEDLTAKARKLRREASDAERLLWWHLWDRRLAGWKFRRQEVIGPYIVDFCCLEVNLVVELDGGQHLEQVSYDTKRTKVLESRGYRALRFWNHEVLNQLSDVLEEVLRGLAGR